MEFTKISRCLVDSLLVGLLSFCGLFSCVHTRQALGVQKVQGNMHNSQPAGKTSTNKSTTKSSSGDLINHGFLPEDSQSEASKLANFERQHPECLFQTNKENLILHNVISTGMLAGTCGILAGISTGIYLWTKGSYSFPESTFMNATTPIDHQATALTTVGPIALSTVNTADSSMETLATTVLPLATTAATTITNLISGVTSFISKQYNPTTQVYPNSMPDLDIKRAKKRFIDHLADNRFIVKHTQNTEQKSAGSIKEASKKSTPPSVYKKSCLIHIRGQHKSQILILETLLTQPTLLALHRHQQKCWLNGLEKEQKIQ